VLNTTAQFQVKLWDTREHHMKQVDCELKVGGDGNLLHEYRNQSLLTF
jgi:hypothetical protein